MLVIEGPDGAGKTTLVQKLTDLMPDWPVAKKSVGSDTKALVDLQTYVDEVFRSWYGTEQENRWKIHDRHTLVSELIYGPILRGSVNEKFKDFRWLQNAIELFWRARPVVVCCLPPLETVVDNLKQEAVLNALSTPERPGKVWQPDEVVANGEKLYWAYYSWAAQRQQIIMYDYTSQGDEQIEWIAQSAEWRKKETR